MSKIDCTGLSCPEPVLRAKNALEDIEEGTIVITVDNVAAKENVSRFAVTQGCTVEVNETGANWEIKISKGAHKAAPLEKESPTDSGTDVAILFLSDKMGENPELGEVLMKAFITTLPNAGNKPAKLIFMNSSVNLTTKGSEVIEDLAALEIEGVEILSCGTCLDFFGKKDELAIGRVTNMYDTIETLTAGHRVVTIT